MIRGRLGSGLVGIMLLLVGAALILVAGPALAQDGARSFTAGSCLSNVFTNPSVSPIYAMYCNLVHSSPPPECRGDVQFCSGTSLYWVVNCPVTKETNFAEGSLSYSIDYTMNGTDCLDYSLLVGYFDQSGTFIGQDFGYPPMCPPGGNITGDIPASFVIPPGSRFGVSLQSVEAPPPEHSLGDDGDGQVCANLKMNTSFFVNATTTPPYPICSREPVPTMTQWGLLLMSLGIAVCGVWAVRRKVARSA
jgi:hypothetical protein